jgi:CubicO group peptidase (beta-lactamase class C family)
MRGVGHPGVALGVISPRLRWVGAAGHDALGSGEALQPDAGFRIASVTKTFTSAAILRLGESGRLGLDDPIIDRLSSATASMLRRGGYDVHAIRIRDLLTHTSGLYDYASDPAFVSYVLAHGRHRWTRREQVRFAMSHGKPYAPPSR